MPSNLYWIAVPLVGRLAIMARPRSGDWLEDEVSAWRKAGINVIVSLLEPDEVSDLDLGSEATLCRAQGITFISYPIPDRGVPASVNEAAEVVAIIAEWLRDAKAVAIHCRAGIGRSALMAGGVLVEAGVDSKLAFEAISTARGVRVPDTEGQSDWLTMFQSRITALR